MIIQGRVIRGQQRGKRLGFPTINIPLKVNYPEGIYLSNVMMGDQTYNALTFIGAARTFNETTYQSETYILDFSQDVYGQEVVITLLKKIRDNQAFESEQELIKQMEEDKKLAKTFFSKQ